MEFGKLCVYTFPALYLNSGKIVFIELLTVNTADTNVHFPVNLEAFTSPKTIQRKYTLNEVMPPLINVSVI